jgi:hypothetical protein
MAPVGLCATIGAMRRVFSVGFVAVLAVVLATRASGDERDPLAEARLLYNQRQFQAAITSAEKAGMAMALADAADLIAARAYLERYRESASADDLTNARVRLRRVDPARFTSRERAEFLVGLGETLFFDESFGAAAAVFDSALEVADGITADARERVLDWWASALDRDAWPRPDIERQAVYQRIRIRMRDELASHPTSATASYWTAASARAQGDLQSAWDEVQAAWVRAPLTMDHGTALRADLDRLMLRAIVPERAKAMGQPADAMKDEWDRFKERWSRN